MIKRQWTRDAASDRKLVTPVGSINQPQSYSTMLSRTPRRAPLAGNCYHFLVLHLVDIVRAEYRHILLLNLADRRERQAYEAECIARHAKGRKLRKVEFRVNPES
ncbi:uncharacterized protein LOC105425186 [Pogonomyrmex barbatus]|uniref:Uncharacterized protein LOC105425186 n=1 Tax=Pogonomyrmex barbatus TaxID=144034 RepID=A0A6I9W6A4_9HYME|nr:uncharacterized protein LOC105425186 [Pogonomyrmex barbatus]